jgi:hypothetical protein
MSKMINGILGLAAASAAFGAVQFASGSDLASAQAISLSHNQVAENIVNRDAKSDRAAVAKASGAAGQTLSFQPQSLSATSVLVRMPAAIIPVETARNNPGQPAPAMRRSAVACEPVVSVLTTVARQLPPGRCVT